MEVENRQALTLMMLSGCIPFSQLKVPLTFCWAKSACSGDMLWSRPSLHLYSVSLCSLHMSWSFSSWRHTFRVVLFFKERLVLWLYIQGGVKFCLHLEDVVVFRGLGWGDEWHFNVNPYVLLGTFSSTKGCCWVLIWPQLFLCFSKWNDFWWQILF